MQSAVELFGAGVLNSTDAELLGSVDVLRDVINKQNAFGVTGEAEGDLVDASVGFHQANLVRGDAGIEFVEDAVGAFGVGEVPDVGVREEDELRFGFHGADDV